MMAEGKKYDGLRLQRGDYGKVFENAREQEV